jgi:NMD protein affecting ribosome stability and mRNA decay
MGYELERMEEEHMVKAKCHWCGAPLPEKNYDVVLYAHIAATSALPPVEVAVCVPCLKAHHRNKATRMEKV